MHFILVEYTPKPFVQKTSETVSALLVNHYVWNAFAFTQMIVYFSFISTVLSN